LEQVAIIGAGPAGLAAARYLLTNGFDPVLFEAHSSVGGQWNVGNPSSGVWPLMRTNTARMVTRFSDLDYPEGTAIFPRNQEVGAYLKSYADKMELTDRIQFNTRLKSIERHGAGWRLAFETDGTSQHQVFPRVVIATGAYNDPEIPTVDGLDGFSGENGAIHAYHYKDPDAYRGKRVLIAGGNISSLEIAQDLAMLGAKSVATTMRRQRYVMPKLVAGTPIESYGFTRGGALWSATASSDEWAAQTKAFVEQYGGNPAWYGAPAPDEDVRIAGTTGSQNFLNLVAEDRIQCHPWMERIDGSTVTFTDGNTEEFDGIIFGTGYRLNLPFLSRDIQRTVELTDKTMTLHERTFHPDTPGLAFMGFWGQAGPYLPVLEQQARYLAYSWAEIVPQGDMDAGLAHCRENVRTNIFQHSETVHFARLAGCEPSLDEYKDQISSELQDILSENAVTSISCRLVGHEALADAERQIRVEARTFGRKDLK
jgi:hypothetical protein